MSYRNPLRSESKPKRQVFPTNEIPHLWMHKTQANARNPTGNLFFNGDTIYSYGTHFPLARHVTVGRKTAVLFNSNGYSLTTSKHQSQVKQAISRDTLVFTVPNLNPQDHSKNLAHFAMKAKQMLTSGQHARKYGESWLNKAFAMKANAKAYCQFFKQKMPDFSFLPTPKQLTELEAKLAQRKARARELDAAKTARREAQRAEVRRLYALELPEKIEAWRNGATLDHYTLHHVPIMLRLNGDEVETSMGARVPKEHAIRALRFVRACVAANREYVRNGHTEHVGNYSIDRIEANGTLHAGCHVISFEEIERFAVVLGQ